MQNKRYSILASLQAALGGITAVAVGVLYVVQPHSLQNSGLSASMALIGAMAATYYFTLHQILRHRHPKMSVITLSLLSGLNVLLVIASTGGLDSPYYSLWLLSIVVAGFFGVIATAILVAATVGYYVYEFVLHNFDSTFVANHSVQLAISLVAAAIAEWTHTAVRRSSSPEEMAHISGQLSQEQFKSEALMNSVGDGVLVVNTDRQVQYFNPAAISMTGWDPDSAYGIDYRLVLNLHRPDGNKLDDNDDPFLKCWQEGKNIVNDDLTVETKGGHKVEISISVSPIYDHNKQITGGIGLFRDISAEKETSRQRDEFISTASHEMRTPVAAVEGYLSLAMNPAVATIDNRAKGYLDKAHTSTQHLGQLFRDLLSITKLEDSGKADTIEVLDLTQLVKEVVSDMQFSADKKGLEIQFGAGSGTVRGERAVLPVYAVRANPQRLREVTMNLIENAIKFTPQGRISVTIGGTDDAVTVSVTDTGVGISNEDIPHLFQKFYRIDNSATRTIGGTGLGLYLCRTIIEISNGKIWVESKLGEGSSFKFSLPRLKNEALQAATNVAPAAPAPAPMPAATPAPTPAPAPAPPVSTPIPAAPLPGTIIAASSAPVAESSSAATTVVK